MSKQIGKTQVCEIMLENGADMDHADKEGMTALFAAASMGHLDILNLLMFWGCYVDGIDCEGRTVLSVAAAEGYIVCLLSSFLFVCLKV